MIGDDKHVRIIDLGDAKDFETYDQCAEWADKYMHKKEHPEEIEESNF